ncbi:MAG: hypothetical protein LBK58_00195 [Prevotellaceae bacterium]|nr:hypothetical protein [Prevotellaceae bacterium]
MADYLNVPEIKGIDLSNYSGQAGDTVRIEADDDTVGTLIEEGQACPDISGYVWIYTAEQNNDSFNYGKIVVSISDLPGNVVEELKEF